MCIVSIHVVFVGVCVLVYRNGLLTVGFAMPIVWKATPLLWCVIILTVPALFTTSVSMMLVLPHAYHICGNTCHVSANEYSVN